MRHQIDRADWHVKLADSIKAADDGDTIVCHNEPMRELGERARFRLCPDKLLSFELESDDTDNAPPPLGSRDDPHRRKLSD